MPLRHYYFLLFPLLKFSPGWHFYIKLFFLLSYIVKLPEKSNIKLATQEKNQEKPTPSAFFC